MSASSRGKALEDDPSKHSQNPSALLRCFLSMEIQKRILACHGSREMRRRAHRVRIVHSRVVSRRSLTWQLRPFAFETFRHEQRAVFHRTNGILRAKQYAFATFKPKWASNYEQAYPLAVFIARPKDVLTKGPIKHSAVPLARGSSSRVWVKC